MPIHSRFKASIPRFARLMHLSCLASVASRIDPIDDIQTIDTELMLADLESLEKRVDALMVIASSKGYFTVDGLRRVLEDMGSEAFETQTYYERWMASTCENLIAEGAFTIEELNAKMEEVRQRGETYGEAQGSGE